MLLVRGCKKTGADKNQHRKSFILLVCKGIYVGLNAINFKDKYTDVKDTIIQSTRFGCLHSLFYDGNHLLCLCRAIQFSEEGKYNGSEQKEEPICTGIHEKDRAKDS